MAAIHDGQVDSSSEDQPPSRNRSYQFELPLITEPIPIWEEDGEDYETYEDNTVRLVESLFEESREYYEKKKREWVTADKLADLEHILDNLIAADTEKSRMPFLPQAMEEWIATRHGDNLRPSVGSRQQSFDQVVGAGNYIMEEELDANLWNLQRLRVGLDQLKFGIGFMRFSIDPDAPGIFGQKGQQRIDRVDPRYVWPDRFATSWRWQDMKYLIIATPMDLSDVRRMWPDRGFLVKPDTLYSLDSLDETTGNGGGALMSRGSYSIQTGANRDGFQIGQRQRVLVMECYLRDTRMRRIPAGFNPDGTPIRNIDGSIACEYVPRFPNGRLIIVANGVLLRDTENPWDHGMPPLVAWPESVTEGLFSYSRLKLLDMVDRKINLAIKEGYGNLRVHMNSPWVIDRNAFTKPSQYDNITQSRKTVFIVRPNARIMRLPPGDLPQQFFPMLDYLKDVFDQVLGVTKIDRGQLEKGSQLSAESVIELQGASGMRQEMKRSLDKEAAKQSGRIMFSNIRQFYPKQMNFQAKDPVTGEPVNMTWNSGQIKNPWDYKVDAGDTASAESSAQQRAVTLFDKGIIDGVEVLRVLNWQQADTVLQRMKDERTRLANLGFVREALRHGVISNAMSQRGPKVENPNI